MGILSYEGDHFLMDGEPFVIRSGSMHYFRVVPEYWEDRMKKLKACGFNTLETYTCWNLHEPREGEFHFEGMLDLERFLETAQSLGLFVILRPGPYICAEFEFGGLPSWLLRYPDMRIRCQDPLYLSKVERYFQELLKRIRPHLSTNGGNVIAMQIENEYGSYGNDHGYLRAIEKIYQKCGIDCLLFTSDGPCGTMISGGTLPDKLATFNFGSRSKEVFPEMRQYFPNQPMMCCEFWNGWFDHWKEEHHSRDPQDVAQELEDILNQNASVNFYMFHGGTNFGFTNGANYSDQYEPTITSYDYDSLLNECGDMTAKYYAVKEVFERHFGPAESIEVHDLPKHTYGMVELTEQADLLEQAEKMSTVVHNSYPLTMEELGQDFGFVLYRTTLYGPIQENTELSIDGLCDRAMIFLNGKLVGIKDRTGYNDDKVLVTLKAGETAQLEILVENMGRVNYGPHIWERKGITGGVRLLLRYEFDWEMISLPCSDLSSLIFKPSQPVSGRPSFLRGYFRADELKNTFLRLDGFTKGVAYINGFCLGRYWNTAGPQKTLYIPAPLLKQGENELIVLELEGNTVNQVLLTEQMDLG